MKEKHLFTRFMGFAIPSVISMWVFSLYSMVDGIFVSKGEGELALAAVNLSIPYVMAIFAVGLLLAIGTSTVVAIFLGQGEEKKARETFTQNIIVVAVLGVIISVFTALNLDSIAVFLGATEETMRYVKEYVGVIAPFAVFFVVSYNLEVLVKTAGAPVVSTVGVASCALTNVVLDYIFVLEFGWGVAGAALATGISQVISTIIFILYFFIKKGKLRFTPFKINLDIYKRILPIGMADGITELSSGIVIFLFNRTILKYIGTQGIVSYTVISYVNNMVLMTMIGVAQGLQPLSSFYHGKKQGEISRKLFRYALATIGFLSVCFLLMGQFLSPSLVSLFIEHNSPLFDYSVWSLSLFSISFGIVGFNVITSGYFASIEETKISMFLSTCRGLVFIIITITIMPMIWDETGVWLASTASETMALFFSIFFLLLYVKKIRTQER